MGAAWGEGTGRDWRGYHPPGANPAGPWSLPAELETAGPTKGPEQKGFSMRIDIVGRDIEITPAIRQYGEQKAEKLSRFFTGLQQVTITVHRTHAHQTHEFSVEIVADVEKHEDFVAHGTGADLYGVIDEVVEKCSRQLRDFKEKLKGH